MFILNFKKIIFYAAVIVTAATFGFVLTKFSAFLSSSNHLLTFFIMALFAILLFLPLMISMAKKRFDAFEPIYLWTVIYAFFYLINPLVLILKNGTFGYGEEFLNKALFLAMLGQSLFYFGYYGSFGRKIAERLPAIKRRISSKKLIITAWALIIVGFWGLNNYIHTSGGWLKFWSKPHGFGGQALKTTAYIYQLPELMVIGFLLMCEIYIHRIVVEKRKVGFRHILNLIAASLGGIGIYTIIWGSRTLYSWVIIAILTLYFLKRGVRPKLRSAVICLFVIFVILTVVPIYRSRLYIGSDLSKMFSGVSFGYFIRNLSHESDEFHTYLAEVALVPNWVPYDNFNLYGRFLVHPIPRLIWRDKPAFLNSKWDEFRAKSGTTWGSAESMLGDFYAQRGFWAIILGTFLSGVFWKTIYAYLKQNIANRSVIIIYAIILPNMFTFIAQSALIAFLKWLPYMVPSAIIALLLSREKKRIQ